MNPNENNPVSPMGADGSMSGAAPVPGVGSMDFTNPANLETNNGLGNQSVSGGMSDDSGATTNIDGTTSGGMTAPMPPLTPAEPVPGSIGSVTSVPPLAPEPMDMGALNNAATTSNMPVMGQAAESKPAASESASLYYNPFTRNNVSGNSNASSDTTGMSATTPTSSATVSPALQPQTEKFSDRLNGAKKPEKKQGNMMMLLGWLLAVLFLVTTIVFVVLWQGEANKKPEIIYIPTTDEGDDKPDEPEQPTTPTEPVAAVLKCTQEESLEGQTIENLTGLTSEALLNYADGALVDLTMNQIYIFTDTEAATAARPAFDEMKTLMDGLLEAGGNTDFSVGVSQLDNIVNYGMTLPASALTAEGVSVDVDVPTNEDGTLDTRLESMKTAFETSGAVCTTE